MKSKQRIPYHQLAIGILHNWYMYWSCHRERPLLLHRTCYSGRFGCAGMMLYSVVSAQIIAELRRTLASQLANLCKLGQRTGEKNAVSVSIGYKFYILFNAVYISYFN